MTEAVAAEQTLLVRCLARDTTRKRVTEAVAAEHHTTLDSAYAHDSRKRVTEAVAAEQFIGQRVCERSSYPETGDGSCGG